MARITTAIGLGVIAASAVLAIFAEPLAYLDSSQALTPYSHGRLSGILGNPNNLGMICAFTAGVSSCIPLRRGKLAIPAICLYISIETGQRAAILATSLLFATLLFAGIARRLNARARPILVLTVAAIIVALGAPLQGLWNTILNERESSITGRYEVWSFVIKNGTELLPIGLGPRGLYKMTSTIDMSEPFAHAHNQFLTWFTLSGIIAVVLAVVLLISWLSGTGSGHFSKSWGIALALTFPMLLESPLYTGFSVANLATATLGWVALAASLPVYRTQPSYA